MDSEKIDKLFNLDEVNPNQCKNLEEYFYKLSKKVDTVFFDNYYKNKEILNFAFDFYHSIKLLKNKENLETLKRVLGNKKYLNILKKLMVVFLI